MIRVGNQHEHWDKSAHLRETCSRTDRTWGAFSQLTSLKAQDFWDNVMGPWMKHHVQIHVVLYTPASYCTFRNKSSWTNSHTCKWWYMVPTGSSNVRNRWPWTFGVVHITLRESGNNPQLLPITSCNTNFFLKCVQCWIHLKDQYQIMRFDYSRLQYYLDCNPVEMAASVCFMLVLVLTLPLHCV